MFRLARAQDLLNLKGKHQDAWVQEKDMVLNHMTHPDYHFSEDFQWNLKQMGSLFCLDIIKEHKFNKLLELGAGFNIFFDRYFGQKTEYWMVDKDGHYNQPAMTAAKHLRKNTKHINALMGENSEMLSNNYFDILFSISAIEHIDKNEIQSVCDDMYRVLRSGGHCVHALDVHHHETQELGSLWYNCLINSGFSFKEQLDIEWRIGSNTEETTLFQTLNCAFGGWNKVNWQNPRVVNYPTGTILINAIKP